MGFKDNWENMISPSLLISYIPQAFKLAVVKPLKKTSLAPIENSV